MRDEAMKTGLSCAHEALVARFREWEKQQDALREIEAAA
jgi:hypothetical protein